MTDWYAPNQQAVRDGKGPSADEPEGDSPGGGQGQGQGPQTTTTEVFDPGDHTVDEVKAYVDANPDEAQAVLDAEVAGKNRSTLVDWLESG